jgi:uncharacterized protein
MKETTMRYSRYTLCVEQNPDEYILFNTLTSAMIVIDREMKDYLDHLEERNGTPYPEEVEGDLQTLYDLRLLSHSATEDDRWVSSWFTEARHDTSTFDLSIMTTYQCNFKCVYCVEEGVKDPIYMDEDIAGKTIRWVEGKLRETNTPYLRVDFYGGEPLLNVPILEYLARELSALTDRMGVSFEFTMTTNGVRLTPDIVDRLVPYGFSGVKITVDGDREAHNARRPFIGGQGSFDRIIENIVAVAGKINVTLGCNIDAENARTIPHLLEILKARGLDKTLYYMIFTPIERTLADTPVGYRRPQRQGLLQIEGLSNAPAPPAPNIGVCTYLTDDNTASVMIGLKEQVLSHGFRTNLNIEAGLCTLKKLHSFILDPMGVIYKCPAHVGHPEFAVGRIDGTIDNSRYAMFVDSVETVWHQCSACEFAPTCAGGCPHEAYLEYGTFYEKACHKDVLAEMSAATIRMQYATMQAC